MMGQIYMSEDFEQFIKREVLWLADQTLANWPNLSCFMSPDPLENGVGFGGQSVYIRFYTVEYGSQGFEIIKL